MVENNRLRPNLKTMKKKYLILSNSGNGAV
jgi:hypothetical protein